MARAHAFFIVTLLSFAAVGCVSSEKYSTVKMDADQYATRLGAVEREKAEAIATRDAYKSQLDSIGLNANQKDALILNQSNQINDLQKQLADLNDRYANAVKNVGQPVFLAPEVNAALKEFAAANPDIISYDENRGMVKFKSDVTFAAGSAVLTPTAASAIDRFAAILNSGAAAGYELMVVGHTDNVPVSHEATRQAGHKDNWYLSAHRAIAVSSELQHHAVSSGRLEVAGCADQRPIANNTDAAGRAQNRRVEVLILPTTVHNTVAVAPAQPSNAIQAGGHVKPAPGLNKDGMNKDAPPVEKKPVYNK
jgi:chemotaxis protein MotB